MPAYFFLLSALASVPRREVPPPLPIVAASRQNKVHALRYLWLLGAVAASAEVATTLVDFQFSRVVTQTLNGQALTRYIVYTVAGASFVAFGVQILVISGLMRRFGITTSALITPTLLTLGALFCAAFPMVASVTILYVVLYGLNRSLHQSGQEVLFSAESHGHYYLKRSLVQVLVTKTAKLFSALLILVAALAGLSMSTFFIAVASVGACWLFATLKLGNRYGRVRTDKVNTGSTACTPAALSTTLSGHASESGLAL